MSKSHMVRAPLPRRVVYRSVARCVVATAWMLARRRIHLPRGRVGMQLRFADGTTGPSIGRPPHRSVVTDPCVLVVALRLRAVTGRGHVLFRLESMLNTPLFAGFPGLVSKLWLAHDEQGRYRGVYEWDGPTRAEHYARSPAAELHLGHRMVPVRLAQSCKTCSMAPASTPR
jgi:hypothetical protein